MHCFARHLHHAAKVVWPGRTFLRRMIHLLCWGHPVRLNREFHLDLLWCTNFCRTGTVSAFGCSQVYCQRHTSRWLPTQLDQLVMENTSGAFGLLVSGLPSLNNRSPLLIGSNFQLSSLLMFGGTCVARSTPYSVPGVLKYLACLM